MKFPVLYLTVVLLLLLSPSSSLSSPQVKSWGYQLQGYNLDSLVSSSFDLLVIDYSKNGGDDGAFSKSEIQRIQESGKKVVCYISIGEAEDYRYYFSPNWKEEPPPWLDEENPDWRGNYKVRYWEPEWQAIIFDYLTSRIIPAGFDGVYLDIIDAYEYYEDTVPNAPELMIDFVRNISQTTKQIQGDSFLIIPQNGEGLLQASVYRQAIDGIGKEDLYVAEDGVNKQPIDTTLYSEGLLDLLIADGKFVLTVDYTNDPSMIRYARNSAAEKGYVEYIGVRDLDRLVVQSNLSATIGKPPFLYLPISLLVIVLVKRYSSK